MKKPTRSQFIGMLSGLVGLVGMILQLFDINLTADQTQTVINFVMMIAGGLGLWTTEPVKIPGTKPKP